MTKVQPTWFVKIIFYKQVAHKSLLKVAGKWAVANANSTARMLDECTTVRDTFVQVWPSDPRLTKIRFVLLINKKKNTITKCMLFHKL